MKPKKILGLGLALAMVALPAITASAALDMFLKFSGGGAPTGETTVPDHPGEIDVLAWSWGVSNSGTTHIGGGGGAGVANVGDLSLTKYVDKASPALMQGSVSGQHFDKAVLQVMRIVKGVRTDYIKITLTDVLVTSVSSGGSGGEDRLTENITLNFAKFTYEYFPTGDDGKPGASIPATWDIATSKTQ